MSKRRGDNETSKRAAKKIISKREKQINNLLSGADRLKTIRDIMSMSRFHRIYDDDDDVYRRFQDALKLAFNTLSDEEQQEILFLDNKYWGGIPGIPTLVLLSLGLLDLRPTALFDPEFLKKYIRKFPDRFKSFIQNAPSELLEELVKFDGNWLYFIGKGSLFSYKQTENIVRNAVEHRPNALRAARDEFINMKSILIPAVSRDGMLLVLANEYLRHEKDVILTAVRQEGKALRFARFIDPEIVWNAIYQDGTALQFAGPWQNDYDIVMVAVTQNGLSLQWASPALQDNYHIVLAALKQNNYAVVYVGPQIDNSKFDGRMAAHRARGWAGSRVLTPRELKNAANHFIRIMERARLNRVLSVKNKQGLPEDKIFRGFLHHDSVKKINTNLKF